MASGIDVTGPRAVFEDLILVDTCTVTREQPPREATFNATTGALAPAVPVTIYTGPCAVRQEAASEQTQGPAPKDIKLVRVTLPWSAAEVLVGDVVTVDTSQDPLLVDARMPVTDVAVGTLQLARKLQCTWRVDGRDQR